jgi:hypothetical protein
MKNATQKKPYITEEEFNRIVADRNETNPEDDSKGDSAIDETVEAELGEHYGEDNSEDVDALEEIEDEDHGHTVVNADREKIISQTSDEDHEGSSTWPDPADISA